MGEKMLNIYRLVYAEFGGIIRDYKVWLLGDFVLKHSENFNLIFLQSDFDKKHQLNITIVFVWKNKVIYT